MSIRAGSYLSLAHCGFYALGEGGVGGGLQMFRMSVVMALSPFKLGTLKLGHTWLEVPAQVTGSSLCWLRIRQGAQASLGLRERLMKIAFSF